MTEPKLFDRHVEPLLLEALEDSPAVLIHGPRQSGKSTLAIEAGRDGGYDYVTFDDDVVRQAALDDPAGFVADLSDRVVLDEVQRVPNLFSTLKMAIDRRREPGRFVAGVVLYDGETCVGFGDGLYAVPIRLLWEPVRVKRRP